MTTWSTAQLIAYQAAVSRFTEKDGALRKAVELAVQMLGAAAGAVVEDRSVTMAIGFERGDVPVAAVLAVCDGESATLELERAGAAHVALAEVDGEAACQMLLARVGEPFDAEEQVLITSMGRMLSVTLNVVRLIESERALHDFRRAFKDVDAGLALLALDGRFSHVNPKLERILGYGSDALVGVLYHDLLDPEDRPESKRAFAALQADGTVIVVEQRLRLPTGGRVWLEVTISRSDDAGQLVVQAQDVTLRKQAENLLLESEDRYRSLVEHLPLIVYRNALDMPGTGLYVSPQVETMLGYPMSAWQDGQDFFNGIVHPDDRTRVYAALVRVLQTGEDLSCEYRVTASDGSTVTVRQEGTVLTDDHGQPLCVQGYILDISAQRRLEEQLRLSQKLEAVGQLAAGVAHEINTPIQFIGDSVRFTVDAVRDLMELIETYREVIAGTAGAERAAAAEDHADLDYLRERLPAAFDRMDDGVQRVATIVGAMKDFAHPPAAIHRAMDVNAALESTLVVTHSQYKYVADVETDLQPLPDVMADDGELKQVFVNLIVNAAHAIEDAVRDGQVRGTIRVLTRTDGDDVVITVADTGCGMPTDVHDRIFDPFFTTKEVGRGTGQGLAIARAIIAERHGGTITLDSEPGNGTTFEIRLPVDGAGAESALHAGAGTS